MTEIFFVNSREVRKIPQGWQHPRDGAGRYIPLLPHYYEYDGSQGPWPKMPDPGNEADIVAYETVTEGTPISPPFPNTPPGRRDLLAYCAAHCTTFADHRGGVEAWAAILFGDAAVGIDGAVIASDHHRSS
jgi:hypothetical protein